MGQPGAHGGGGSIGLSLRRYLARPGVRAHPARMLARRVTFEFERGLMPGRLSRPRVIQYGDGLGLEVDLSRPKERAPYLLGRPEYASTMAFLELVRPAMSVIDAGANIGEYTLLAAEAAGPSGRVLAIEPNAAVRARLARNIERNGLANVTVGAYALGRDEHDAILVFDPADPREGRVTTAGASFPGWVADAVRVHALDDVIAELGWDRVDVIKLDVEGAEADALEGGRATIDACHPAVLFEVNGIHQAADGWTAPAIDWLRARGYRMYVMGMDGPRATRSELAPGVDPRGLTERGTATNLLALAPRPAN